MAVATVLNDRAKRKYTNMLTSLELLVGLLPNIEREIRKMNSRAKGRTYRMATPDELMKMVSDVRKSIVDFTEKCKQYETKLTTNEWKV
jgi:hypothetical protein